MRRARQTDFGEIFTFGGRVPPTVGALITAIVLASLFGQLGQAYGLRDAAALVPGLVLQGQVWRVATWVFFERDPMSLLFGGITLYFFGRDLCWAWGARRFLGTFFGIAIATGLVTCVVALGWTPLQRVSWTGSWPVLLALTVAWAMIFPERQILLMFALPVSGRALLWVTLGGTVLYAVFYGVHEFVPHFAAQLLMMAYARGWSLRGFWQQLRIKGYERRARRRASHLKVVKKDPPRWMN
jgi:membrane associated rhomboid family serine protease